VKRDWEIISLLATEMGYPMHYDSNQQIWDEMRELCPLFYGVTYEKMGEMGHVQWPCPTLDHPERRTCTKTISSTPQPVKGSSLPHGARRLKPGCGFPAGALHGARSGPLLLPLNDRELRRAAKPGRRTWPGADEPSRCGQAGHADGQLVWVRSPGKVITRASISERINAGAVYMTYQWWIGACNELTQDNLDPISKTPETKYCAAAGGD
jgi:formate dehydrogenase major subunit